MPSRSFLVRLCLAMLGMLLVCVTIFAALGWAVRYPSTTIQAWTIDLLGAKRAKNFRSVYLRTLGTRLPGDRDGDSFPDSVERYLGTRPDNPDSSPPAWLITEPAGFTAHQADRTLPGLGTNFLSGLVPPFLLQPGERRRMHLRLVIDGKPAAFARGAHSLLTPVSPCLLGLPNGTPTNDELLVPMATDGTMEFDLAAPPNQKPASSAGVIAKHPGFSHVTPVLNVFIASRLPPLPCTAESVALAEIDQNTWSMVLGEQLVSITWRPTDSSGQYFVEATRDESGREWTVVAVCEADEHQALIAYRLLENGKPGHRGPLRFRVVPTEPGGEGARGGSGWRGEKEPGR